MAETSLVIGAGDAIGREVVARCTADGHDAVLQCDMPAPSEVDPVPFVQTVVSLCHGHRVGRIVMNLSGGPITSLQDIELSELQRAGEAAIMIPALCLQALLASMRAARKGRIVAITGGLALAGPGASIRSAVDSAIEAAVRTWAMELGKDGVTVNAVSPGLFESPDARRVMDAACHAGFDPANRIALRRWCTPQDVAAVVAFLLSEEASYITGQTIHVSGGLNLG